mmetsp:Transcript_38414/g.80443  ORF Transcript_38414/g.80443 Transcript_38414/m.80443 type:complete len:200 (-) Transcript_38414:9-608(-)
MVDADAFVDLLDVLRRHRHHTDRTSVHGALGGDLDASAHLHILHATTRAGEPRAHDGRSTQHELDGALVNLHLRHHGGKLVQQAQCWQPRAVTLLPKERYLVDYDHGNVVLALGDDHGTILGPYLLEDAVQPRILLLDLLFNAPLHGTLHLVLPGDIVGLEALEHRTRAPPYAKATKEGRANASVLRASKNARPRAMPT